MRVISLMGVLTLVAEARMLRRKKVGPSDCKPHIAAVVNLYQELTEASWGATDAASDKFKHKGVATDQTALAAKCKEVREKCGDTTKDLHGTGATDLKTAGGTGLNFELKDYDGNTTNKAMVRVLAINCMTKNRGACLDTFGTLSTKDPIDVGAECDATYTACSSLTDDADGKLDQNAWAVDLVLGEATDTVLKKAKPNSGSFAAFLTKNPVDTCQSKMKAAIDADKCAAALLKAAKDETKADVEKERTTKDKDTQCKEVQTECDTDEKQNTAKAAMRVFHAGLKGADKEVKLSEVFEKMISKFCKKNQGPDTKACEDAVNAVAVKVKSDAKFDTLAKPQPKEECATVLTACSKDDVRQKIKNDGTHEATFSDSKKKPHKEIVEDFFNKFCATPLTGKGSGTLPEATKVAVASTDCGKAVQDVAKGKSSDELKKTPDTADTKCEKFNKACDADGIAAAKKDEKAEVELSTGKEPLKDHIDAIKDNYCASSGSSGCSFLEC